jgi:O-antigen/teichoic acid export membrane protein
MTQSSASMLADPPQGAPSREAPTPLRSLAHSFTWTLAGMLTYGVCQWGMLVILARLGSDETLVGQFALALAITAPILLLAGMSLRTVQATDHAQDFLFGDYLGLQLVTIALALVATITIALVSGHSAVVQGAIALIGLAKALELISDLFYGLQQRHDRMDRVGKSLVIKGIASLVAVATGVYLTGSVVGAAASLVLIWGLLLMFYDVRNGLQTARWSSASELASMMPRFNVSQLRALARLALPMGIMTMLGALIANLPRYFVDHYLGEKQLGIFAALAYFTIAGNLVAGALAQSTLPRLSRFYAAGQSALFRRLLLKLLTLGAILGLLGILLTALLGRTVLGIYGSAYADRSDVFLVLMISLACTFEIFFLDYALFAARRFQILSPINAVMVVLTAVASWLIIPPLGLLGAAWVTCLIAAVQMALRCVVVWRVVGQMPKEALPEAAGVVNPLHDRGEA